MKKLLSCLFLLFITVCNAQCVITGTSSPQIYSTNTFSVPANLAQCANCYFWSVSGTATINGATDGNTLSLTTNTPGTITVTVTYFANGTMGSCSKTLNVVLNNGCTFQVGIVNGFLANPTSNPPTVTLFASVTPGSISGVQYNWMVTYQNGSTAGASSNTSQQAVFVATQANPIVSTQIIAYYQGCSSTTSRRWPNPIYAGGGGLGGGGGIGFGRLAEPGSNNPEKFVLAPNPVSSELSFTTDGTAEGYSVLVYDLNGREIINAPIKGAIPFDNQSKGIYQFVITGPDDYLQTGKVVKN